MTNQVEIRNLNHNHPRNIGRRSAGEVMKLKQALQKKRLKSLKN